MKTRILGFALSVAGAVSTPLLAEPAAAQSPSPTTYERQVAQATNQHRDRRDRVELRRQACVQKYAVRQAKRMARQERMYHQDLGPVLRDCGLSSVGENVAYGYPSGRSAVNRGWMRSTGHRENILRSSYRLLGVGARRDDDGTWYAAQVFGRG